jgi:hypothetical protein
LYAASARTIPLQQMWVSKLFLVHLAKENVSFSYHMVSSLMPLSTIFQLYRCGQFYWCRKPEFPEKTTDLSQAAD